MLKKFKKNVFELTFDKITINQENNVIICRTSLT